MKIAMDLDVAAHIRADEPELPRGRRQVAQRAGSADLEDAHGFRPVEGAAVVTAKANRSVLSDQLLEDAGERHRQHIGAQPRILAFCAANSSSVNTP
jgi:hypothetical protein